MTQHLVGGISSLGRDLPIFDGITFSVSRSSGASLCDGEGARYVDTAMGFGATILGHAYPPVLAEVSQAMCAGPMPGFSHQREEAAAAALTRHTGNLDRVIFVNSGSEAVHLACRIARAETGRSRIAKFAAGYDGWYDGVAFGNAGSRDAAMQANERPSNEGFVLLRFNDRTDVDRLFAERDDIAAVLAEPVLANAGTLPPDPGYLVYLQTVARRHGAMMIADEVLMGFRLHCGLASYRLGLDPDLATVGKAIGSGIGVAAVIGSATAMAGVERGRIIRAGTYSGNPIACAAVIATIDALEQLDYPALLLRGEGLRKAITDVGQDIGRPVSTTGFGSVFTIWFSAAAPRNYSEATSAVRADLTMRLHLELRRRGVLTMPLPFGRLFLSAAHDQAIIDEIADKTRDALTAMSGSW
jgi:glutamate-1-semialdehyde 2,1-aminomutase